jgi:hypothetical protein
VDLGASQGHGEDHLRQLLRVRGHSSGEGPLVAVILGAVAGVPEQLAGHRRNRLVHIEQRDALSVVVRSGRVVDAVQVLGEQRTTFCDRLPLRLTLAAFCSTLGLRISGGFDARHDSDMALHVDAHEDDVSGVLLDVCRVARLPGVLRVR